MKDTPLSDCERTLILAPRGRDAAVAHGILSEAQLSAHICDNLSAFMREIERGADVAIITEEATRTPQIRELCVWVARQPPWSDFPFVLLTEHGGGLERNPAAAQLMEFLGNVTFLERPFHPTTLVSLVRASLRGRRRQYECQRLNAELESRVDERTAELAAANRLLLSQIEERERVESTLRQMQRLEAVGQLTSGVAHDFNNLLTVVLGNIGFLEKGFTAAGIDGKLAQRLGYMRIAAERGAKLTDQLLSFSRRQRLDPRAIDLNETVSGMRDLLQSTLGGRIRIETEFQDGLWLALVDPTRLELAVLNLGINARDAMEVGGMLRVVTRNVSVGAPRFPEEPPAGDYVGIFVIDDGSGMPDGVRAKVFEPFFTTKEVGKGSGLGLSQVLGFAKQSGGGVCIDTEIGKGTSVGILLPRTEITPLQQSLAPAFENQAEARERRGAHILLVDDDNAVREVTAAILRELGYVVLEAGSGGAALDVLGHERNIDLLIVDFAMPGMNGAEVARLTRAKYPALPILFLTGFADRAAMGGVEEADIIGKPFIEDELARKIRATLNADRAQDVVRFQQPAAN
ncbi:MAG TPA: response regulator [Micropepsaceae bacterium]|nr:response regulator [Micropepsaceae bacterium]